MNLKNYSLGIGMMMSGVPLTTAVQCLQGYPSTGLVESKFVNLKIRQLSAKLPTTSSNGVD